MMTPTELRIRSDQYRQQLAQSIQSAKACRAPELAVLAEFVFAVVEIGGELCAQVAELRGHRARRSAEVNVSTHPVHPDFLELAAAKAKRIDLIHCFAHQVALHLHREFGNYFRAAAAVGVNRVTLCKWGARGRKAAKTWQEQESTPQARKLLALPSTCARIAGRLLREENNNRKAAFRRFARELAGAAIALEKGNKAAAARRLQASEAWVADRNRARRAACA